MQLEHSFSVPVGIDEAWRVLLDIERIAPCIPGAMIESTDGREIIGAIKVKLGAIGPTYRGTAVFAEKDDDGHRAVITAHGDTRGNGSATARVVATLSEFGGATSVMLMTDIDFTGKPGQLEQAVISEAGAKMVRQFAERLTELLAGEPVTPWRTAPLRAEALPTADRTPAVAEVAEPISSRVSAASDDGATAEAGASEYAVPAVSALDTAPFDELAAVVEIEAIVEPPAAVEPEPVVEPPAAVEPEPVIEPPAAVEPEPVVEPAVADEAPPARPRPRPSPRPRPATESPEPVAPLIESAQIRHPSARPHVEVIPDEPRPEGASIIRRAVPVAAMAMLLVLRRRRRRRRES